jgi:hypothetical protein
MTAKEKVLERPPELSETQAEAVLRMLDAQDELETYFEAKSKLSEKELQKHEEHRGEGAAHSLLQELDAEEETEFGETISEAWGRKSTT